MLLRDYVMDIDREMISFSFSLLEEVDEKIQKKILFYENQVTTYVQNKISIFITSLNLSSSMKIVCKSEVTSLIRSRLKAIMARYCLFRSC
ncbi:hypothetical protein ACQCVE_02360 [Metabacillus sp. 113a]